MTQIISSDEMNRLQRLTERAIGELPFRVVEIAYQDRLFIVALEHVTDGICCFTLPSQIVDLTNSVVRLLINQEIEHILDLLWDRVELDD